MSNSSGYNYIMRGRRWARGWNRYEARTMNWLFGILATSAIVGLILGFVIGTTLQLSPVYFLVLVIITGLTASWGGIAVAKTTIPFIWDTMLTRELEK